MKRFALILLSALVAAFLAIQFGNDLLRGFESDMPSRSHGSTKQGWLENGKRLPTAGANFTSYSRLGALAQAEPTIWKSTSTQWRRISTTWNGRHYAMVLQSR